MTFKFHLHFYFHPNGVRVERRPLTREESEAFRSSHRGKAASVAPRCRSNESWTARSAGQLDVRQLALRWLARLAPSRLRLSKPVILSTLISRSKGPGLGAAPTNARAQPRRAQRGNRREAAASAPFKAIFPITVLNCVHRLTEATLKRYADIQLSVLNRNLRSALPAVKLRNLPIDDSLALRVELPGILSAAVRV